MNIFFSHMEFIAYYRLRSVVLIFLSFVPAHYDSRFSAVMALCYLRGLPALCAVSYNTVLS